jgi:hypothetical protein
MNKIFTSVAMFALFTTAGCTTVPKPDNAPAADREAIQRALPAISEYEHKRQDVKKAITFLIAHGLFDSDSGKEVKDSMDIEYVYYEASIISLAHGNMDDYRNFVQLAEKELDRAKTAVTARVQALKADRAS